MRFHTHGDELFLTGSLSIIHSSSLLELLQKQILQEKEKIILNLKEVESLDITILQLFVAAKKSAKKEKKRLILAEIPQQLYDSFRLSGVDSIFKLKLD